MSGTIATYQGYPCRDVRFRRTRGWRADTTTVVAFAADFPGGFEFATPRPGDLLRRWTEVRTDLRAIRGEPMAPRPAPLPRRFEFAGALIMAEVDRLGNEYAVVVDPLYCVSVETVRRNQDGTVAVVVVRLVDARYFYGQGFIRRWSFNRTNADGERAADSVKDDGQPFTLGEIAKDVAHALFGAPALARYPAAWDQAHPTLELPRFSPAASALAKLAQDHGAGELCLCLDGSVALYSPAEGRVGFAPGGKGPGNAQDLPANLFLDLKGTGQSRGTEATYPPDFCLVVGGLRVASVRMDDLDPVLVIDGLPVSLKEETVRKLTGGKFGLAWLNEFVLAPQAYQNEVDLDPRVVQLLREQAYRLWRIPGVEVEQPFQEAPAPPGAEPRPQSLFTAAPLPSFDQVVAGLRRETSGQPSITRGPNAHLLPLLDRAETVGGRRLPVWVDAFRFASVHREMGGTKEASDAAAARRELEALREDIRQRARRTRKPDPFDGVSWYFGFDSRYMSMPELTSLLHDLGLRHVTDEQLQRAVSDQRLLDRIREVDGELGQRYEQGLRKLYELAGQAGGPGTTIFDLAREIVAFERDVAEARDAFETPGEEAREQAGRLRDKIQDELRALDRQVEEERLRTRVGGRRTATPHTAVFVRNLPRQLDADARVSSAELGIVQTSDLSGHVAEEGVPVAEATTFVPKSPLVTFGAVLRPRVDANRKRTVTGQGSSSSETKIPAVLSDTESYYTAAFARVEQGPPRSISLEAIPAGEGVPVERPDLVELVPLEGPSNRPTLDQTALTIAAGLFGRPDKIESAKYSVARPWPVNCDGVVAGVEIAMRPNGKGFVTTVVVGSEAPILKPFVGSTRVRAKPAADGAAREGLLP